ncbi:MAG TPA: hypothetical protein VGB72_03610 [Acidobacteriota bacterium]
MRYLGEELRPLLEKKELLQLVLVVREGMVLDAEGKLFNPEQLAALFLPVYLLLQNISRDLPLERVEEISVRALGPRIRVVLQPFTVAEASYLLIALFPITTFYRQITADVIRVVKDVTRKLTSSVSPVHEGPPGSTGGKSGP